MIAASQFCLGSDFEATLHARMKAAGVVDHAGPPQNRLAFRARREVNVETPVASGRRVAKDVGISPFDNVVHMQSCWGRPKRQIVGFDYVNLRLGATRQGHEREKAKRQRPACRRCHRRPGRRLRAGCRQGSRPAKRPRSQSQASLPEEHSEKLRLLRPGWLPPARGRGQGSRARSAGCQGPLRWLARSKPELGRHRSR